jgi:hypothetical protein
VDTLKVAGGGDIAAWYDSDNSKQYIALSGTGKIYWLEVKEDHSLEGTYYEDLVTSYFGRGGVAVASDGFVYAQGLFTGVVVFDAYDMSASYATLTCATGVTRKVTVSNDGSKLICPTTSQGLMVYDLNDDRNGFVNDAADTVLVAGSVLHMAVVDPLDRVWTATRIEDGTPNPYIVDLSGETAVLVDSVRYMSVDSTVSFTAPRDVEFVLNEAGTEVVKIFVADFYMRHLAVMEKDAVSGIWAQTGVVAEDFSLNKNYPNPFNPTTTINYTLDNASNMTLAIYNMAGQLVETLVSGYRAAGTYNVVWNGANAASGAYVAKLTVNGQTLSLKMTLLK